MRRAILPLVLAAAFATPAGSEDRYRLEKTADGYVRMDTQTGEMSVCTETNAQLVCRLAADERSALQDEVERLRGAVEVLEGRVAALEGGRPAASLPSEEEFERTMDFAERFMRRFMDIARDIEDPSGGQPDRT